MRSQVTIGEHSSIRRGRRHRAREESYPHAGGVPERRRLQVQRTTGMSSGVSLGQGSEIPAAAVDWSFQTMGYLVS